MSVVYYPPEGRERIQAEGLSVTGLGLGFRRDHDGLRALALAGLLRRVDGVSVEDDAAPFGKPFASALEPETAHASGAPAVLPVAAEPSPPATTDGAPEALAERKPSIAGSARAAGVRGEVVDDTGGETLPADPTPPEHPPLAAEAVPPATTDGAPEHLAALKPSIAGAEQADARRAMLAELPEDEDLKTWSAGRLKEKAQALTGERAGSKAEALGLIRRARGEA